MIRSHMSRQHQNRKNRFKITRFYFLTFYCSNISVTATVHLHLVKQGTKCWYSYQQLIGLIT